MSNQIFSSLVLLFLFMVMPITLVTFLSDSESSKIKLPKRNNNHQLIIPLAIIFLVIVTPFSSAGFLSDLKARITGEASQTVAVNITLGVPEIRNVYNETMTPIVSGGLYSGPSNTSIIINFSAFLATGVSNLNNATATINFSKAGELLRQNSTCHQYQGDGANTANYTCNVTMQWYDAAGLWTIEAFIADTGGNTGFNKSTNFTVGETTGFQIGSLIWPPLAPGQTNQTSVALILNNTGNKAIGANKTQINATNLTGETNSSFALYANNMSVTWDDTALESCDLSGGNGTAASNLSAGSLQNVSTANLTRGNYITNDNATGQEAYYFCIRTVGSELSSQSYSTLVKGPWQLAVFSLPLFLFSVRRKKTQENKSYKKLNKIKNDA